MKYRTEDYSGGGFREIVDVMAFECHELCNIDILDYLLYHYTLTKEIKEKLRYYIKLQDDLENENITLDEYNAITANDDMVDFFKEVVNVLNKELNMDLKYCLWLADEDVVRQRYNGENIDIYEESDVILSNLGKDGCLYAYEEMPKPIA